jgi:peptide/nickel transport system permease protein
MSTSLSPAAFPAGRPKPPSTWAKLSWYRFRQHPVGLVGAGLLGCVVGCVVMGIVLLPAHAAFFTDLGALRQPPTLTHPLGTDEVGRDVAARILYAGRVSLTVGFLAALVGVLIGTLAGALAGYFGGRWIDTVIMRVVDVLLSIPALVSLICLASLLGPGLRTTIVVIAALSWMEIARIIRANVLRLRETEFIQSARAVGCAPARILLRHLIPNTIAPVTVAATLAVGNAILTETALSYLGLGIQPPTPSWGNMLFNAQVAIFDAPWIALFPGAMIMLTVLAVNLIGEGVRDAVDPRALVRPR